MLQAAVYNQAGEKTGAMELPPQVFGVAPSSAVLHQVIVAQEANARHAIAHTKTRGEVSGGGKKPWKQKGTGRARAGSTRSPLWVGGGTTFGPRSVRNFALRINTKMRRQAVRMALSDKVSAERFLIVEEFTPVAGKTKEAAAILHALSAVVPTERRAPSVLVVLDQSQRGAARSMRNLPRTSGIDAAHLNTRDIVKHDLIVATREAVATMIERLNP
ncbi:MAG: 50S ribosomal protein L4 [bacterium]|nr:50S ribosomal protein L4 [bacterium]